MLTGALRSLMVELNMPLHHGPALLELKTQSADSMDDSFESPTAIDGLAPKQDAPKVLKIKGERYTLGHSPFIHSILEEPILTNFCLLEALNDSSDLMKHTVTF